MKKLVLVTGTDTGVGKTVVSCALLRALRQRGYHPIPIKPVETGCSDLQQPEDALALSAAAGGIPLEVVCPVRGTGASAAPILFPAGPLGMQALLYWSW